MIIGVTGHRDAGQEAGELEEFARLFVGRLCKHDDLEIITGMALGWDLAVAEACDYLGVPFWAAIPFTGQDAHWKPADRNRHWHLTRKAKRVHVACPLPLTDAYHRRDRWIVDQCAELHALDSGRKSGTHTTVLYAEKVGRKVVPLWDEWTQFRARR